MLKPINIQSPIQSLGSHLPSSSGQHPRQARQPVHSSSSPSPSPSPSSSPSSSPSNGSGQLSSTVTRSVAVAVPQLFEALPGPLTLVASKPSGIISLMCQVSVPGLGVTVRVTLVPLITRSTEFSISSSPSLSPSAFAYISREPAFFSSSSPSAIMIIKLSPKTETVSSSNVPRPKRV
ncbi:MAG TPA: hypothetical protein ENN29_11210 [Candidatus Hydrogenedentes bacterium]|nr:hypothetical protein [Candidatus Hydrogenedentota bacterium]